MYNIGNSIVHTPAHSCLQKLAILENKKPLKKTYLSYIFAQKEILLYAKHFMEMTKILH